MMNPETENKLRALVRWGLYPASWLVVLVAASMMLSDRVDEKTAWTLSMAVLFPVFAVVEWRLPYQARWAMTFPSFVSDMKYLVVNSAFMSVVSAGLALFTISLSGNTEGMASTWPLPLQLIACMLIFEAINYILHRTMHEARGQVGKTLWRIHAVHHLPPRLYVLMHAVFHPLNSLIIQPIALIFPVWIMGYSQDTVTLFLMIMGMHGLLSHFNVDIRMGWANRVFVGPELHRYHHSADVSEAKNYGGLLSVYDQLFGTFVYTPGTPPEHLGVDAASNMPPYDQTLEVLRLPFNR